MKWSMIALVIVVVAQAALCCEAALAGHEKGNGRGVLLAGHEKGNGRGVSTPLA